MLAINAVLGAIVGIPAAVYLLLDPRNRPAPPSAFRRIAKLSQLTEGVPQQAVVRDTRWDAWTLHPNALVGRVWLVRRGPKKVDAYTTICPHLGCSINHVSDPAGDSSQFVCPCHKGTWELSGKKVSGPVPRDMDSLEVQLVETPDGTDAFVEVKYENFRQGEPQKEVKS